MIITLTMYQTQCGLRPVGILAEIAKKTMDISGQSHRASWVSLGHRMEAEKQLGYSLEGQVSPSLPRRC